MHYIVLNNELMILITEYETITIFSPVYIFLITDSHLD